MSRALCTRMMKTRQEAAPRRIFAQRAAQRPAEPETLRRNVAAASELPSGSSKTQGVAFKSFDDFFQPSQYRSLKQVEQSLREYCDSVSGKDRIKVLRTLEQLLRDHHNAEARTLDPNLPKAEIRKAHQQLEGLDSMVRELRQVGNIKLMVDAMAHLQHKISVAEEDKRRKLEASQSQNDSK